MSVTMGVLAVNYNIDEFGSNLLVETAGTYVLFLIEFVAQSFDQKEIWSKMRQKPVLFGITAAPLMN